MGKGKVGKSVVVIISLVIQGLQLIYQVIKEVRGNESNPKHK